MAIDRMVRSSVCLVALLLFMVSVGHGDDDPIVAIEGATTPLTVSECIDATLLSNAGLRAERERRGELSGLKKQAVSIGLPSIDLTGSWSRGRDPSFALDETFAGGGDDSDGAGSILDSLFGGASFIPAPEDIAPQTFWRTSVNARWDINPGLIYNAIGAAGVGVDRQEVLITDAENRMVESAMAAYYSVIMAGEQLAAADADLEAKREFLDVTRRRFYLGLSTELDTLRAAVSYSNLIPMRRSAETALRDAGANINALMGRPPFTPLTVTGDLPVELEEISVDDATSRVTERPDIRQLELLEKILKKNRGAQKADQRPSLSADASYGYVTGDLDQLTDEGHDFWSASVRLTVPIFDGLLTRGRVQETAAQIERTRLEREEAERQARLELMTLIGDLDAARHNLKASSMNLDAADDAVYQMTRRYELGKADYLSVLDIQANRLLARSNYIDARNRVLTLTASLKRALGFSPLVPLADIRDVILENRSAADRAGQ